MRRKGRKSAHSSKMFQNLSLSFAASACLIKDVDLVVSQVQRDHAAQRPEGSLPHPDDAAALQVEVGEVGSVQERSPGQLLQVVVPQVQLHRYLEQRGCKESGAQMTERHRIAGSTI